MTLIAIIITLLYLSLIGSLIYGFDKVPEFSLRDLKPKTKFSVVIPFRNEETQLTALMESISKLNYPKDLFEIVMVDDESDDESNNILDTYLLHKNSKIDIHVLKTIRKTKSPKKDALTLGISHSKHDWIVTTDADCVLPPFWLDTFDEFIQRHQPEFVVAPVTYSRLDKFLYRFQLLDILSLQGTTIGAFGIGKPMLCNGANLTYTKNIFEAVHGFEGNTHIASGDDVFLLEKVTRQYPDKVKFLKCKQVLVTTSPQQSLDDLITQRVRWAAKTSSYSNWFGKLTGITVFLMNGGLMVFGLMALIGIIKLNIFLYLLIIKFGVDFLLIFKTTTFINQKEAMTSFPFAFLLYPFFIVYVVFASVFKGYRWKGRDYIK
ncbi:MAG TPA: glycosyltransferase [Aquaticitalea sp.]|nr:glycosyltransferase [Aquaticitalea sp.]